MHKQKTILFSFSQVCYSYFVFLINSRNRCNNNPSTALWCSNNGQTLKLGKFHQIPGTHFQSSSWLRADTTTIEKRFPLFLDLYRSRQQALLVCALYSLWLLSSVLAKLDYIFSLLNSLSQIRWSTVILQPQTMRKTHLLMYWIYISKWILPLKNKSFSRRYFK